MGTFPSLRPQLILYQNNASFVDDGGHEGITGDGNHSVPHCWAGVFH